MAPPSKRMKAGTSKNLQKSNTKSSQSEFKMDINELTSEEKMEIVKVSSFLFQSLVFANFMKPLFALRKTANFTASDNVLTNNALMKKS